jgi:hypothetical protein
LTFCALLTKNFIIAEAVLSVKLIVVTVYSFPFFAVNVRVSFSKTSPCTTTSQSPLFINDSIEIGVSVIFFPNNSFPFVGGVAAGGAAAAASPAGSAMIRTSANPRNSFIKFSSRVKSEKPIVFSDFM